MSEDTNQDVPKHIKYAHNTKKYQEKLYRSAFAIKKELHPGLEALVEKSGAHSVSNLLSCLSLMADEAGPALHALVSKANEQLGMNKKASAKAIGTLAETLKDSGMTPEEIEELRQQVIAKRGAAS